MHAKVYADENSLDRLSQFENEIIYFVCDPFLKGSKNLERITKKVKSSNEIIIYTNVVPEPPIEKVTAGILDMQQHKPTVIVAVGGGSAIDTAKAIRYFYEKLGNDKLKRFIAIPTTSGTGSEVTSASVISDPAAKIKYPIFDKALIPDESLLDPMLVISSPPTVTAYSGLDVLTHALESAVATGKTEYTSAIAERAITIVFEDLVTCVNQGTDLSARRKMHAASCLAGLAFDASGLGICHAIAHQVGAQFHVPHGLANAMLLPYVVEANAAASETAKECYAALSKRLQFCPAALSSDLAVMKLVKKIHLLAKECHVPTTLKEFGVDSNEAIAAAETIAQQALKDATYPTNPVAFDGAALKKVYLKIVQ